MKTRNEQIAELEALKGSDKLLENRNRSGFIYFNSNGLVVFIEIHREIESYEAFTFEKATPILLRESFINAYDDIPDYNFKEIWTEPYTYSLEELKERIIEKLQ